MTGSGRQKVKPHPSYWWVHWGERSCSRREENTLLPVSIRWEGGSLPPRRKSPRYGEFQVQDQQGCVSPSSPGKPVPQEWGWKIRWTKWGTRTEWNEYISPKWDERTIVSDWEYLLQISVFMNSAFHLSECIIHQQKLSHKYKIFIYKNIHCNTMIREKSLWIVWPHFWI